MRNLKPVTKTTLGEQVALQLADMISDGKWKAGQKLPSESELCGALHIGRSTLREALKSLAFVGMVRMRPGEGTYVAERNNLFLDRILGCGTLKTEQDIAEVWEARMVLETELAAFAAERITDEGLRVLETLLGRMQTAMDSNGNQYSYSELDVEFHLAIAASSRNKILHQLLIPIRGTLQEWIMKSQELPGLRENAHIQHVKILEAIRERNPEKARKAMQSHLQTFQRAITLFGKITDGVSVGA